MARSYAPLMTSIWSDDDFRCRSPEAQRVYLLAFSQPNISYAGVVPYTARRWARMSAGTTPADIDKAIGELIESHFVLLDDETEELWIRSFVKHNGVLDQPQLRKAMHKAYGEVLSGTIREAFLATLPEAERRLLAPCAYPDGSLRPGSLAAPGQRPESSSGSEPESSSSSRRADDDEDRIASAVAIIAERVLALRVRDKGPVTDPAPWLAKVAKSRRRRHEDAIAAFVRAHPHASAADLADHLEPELAPKQASHFDPHCEMCDGATWVMEDDGVARPCPRCRPV